MDTRKTALLLAALLILTPTLCLGRDPAAPSWSKAQDPPRAGGPKGMSLYEQVRQANEDMQAVVVDDAPVVPPGEDPPADLPPEGETAGQGAERPKQAPADKR